MVVIAGAGIGGLTLGCALARMGRPFRIFERSGLAPAGAGIALSANALQALQHIGLEQQVRRRGRELAEAAICDWRGRELLSVAVRELVPGGTVAMSRASLQQALLDEAGAAVQSGATVTGYEQREGLVRVHLAGTDPVDADLLVGADGLRSRVRAVMRGTEPLRYSGQTSWRAIVDAADLDRRDRVVESWGARQRFGIVPLAGPAVYWFATAEAPAGGNDPTDPRDALRTRFAGWHPPVDRLLAATDADRIIRTDIFDRPPIDRWVDHRTVLLGDAAHPMTPDMGMGGCQAIEDAVVLADALGREATVERALARYEARRVRRANAFVVRSRRMGRIAHLGPAPLRWVRDRVLRATPLRLLARGMARDFRFALEG